MFQNVGGESGSAAVTFTVPDKSASCRAIIPLTLPQSFGEASCDLGYPGLNYWGFYGVTGPNAVGPPVTIQNP